MFSEAEPRTGSGYFDGQAQRWSSLYESKVQFGDRFRLFVDRIQRACPFPARILDFGCGPGVIGLALARLGHLVVGVDAAPSMIYEAERARRRLGIGNARFVVMDGDHLALTASSFDAVVCSSVLQYIRDDRRLLVELVSTLRPGGVLLASIPHRASVLGLMEAASVQLQQLVRSDGGGFLRYSLRLYGKAEFLRLLESLSMRCVGCTYFEFPGLGKCGIPLSRLPFLGMLLLVVARRDDAGAPQASPPPGMRPASPRCEARGG